MIDDAEKQLRQEAADYARASVELSGLPLCAEYEAEAARWVRGEIDDDELTARTHAIAQNLLGKPSPTGR